MEILHCLVAEHLMGGGLALRKEKNEAQGSHPVQ